MLAIETKPFRSLVIHDGEAVSEAMTQGRGRLTSERTQEVYDCVLTLLVDTGYEALTMDAVAQAASISKATLYRQWGGKQTLVVDAIESNHPKDGFEEIDTGSLRDDLHAFARLLANAPEKNAKLIYAVMHACTVNEDLRTAMRDRMIDREDDDFLKPYERAAARGEIDPDSPALPYLRLVFIGPFLLRHLLEDKEPDETYLIGLIDSVVLPALGTH